ncbi:MAG: glycosyltransferase family 2 protein [Acidobacteriaceae bacterium]
MEESLTIDPAKRGAWQVPSFETLFWQGRRHDYCVVVPVINEGRRIIKLLLRMVTLKIDAIADILLVDGGSTDGSLQKEWLIRKGVSGLLLKTGPGKLGSQLRCAYAFALDQGYEGIVTIDGNDKDDPKAIPSFLDALRQGVDFVQASRFISEGEAENTPLSRNLAIRMIHAPVLSLFSGFKWTDTTQGFRAYSRNLLLDEKVAPFRDIFLAYELLAYLSYRVPRLGYKCVELPTFRHYPKGKMPTKISSFKGNLSILSVLFLACLGAYNPGTHPRHVGPR